MSELTIWSVAVNVEEDPIPLFLGRENGTVEHYLSAADADLGKPSTTMYGHRKAVTGISIVGSDEVYSCSLDGTVRQWTVDPDAATPAESVEVLHVRSALRCIGVRDGVVYAGGDDGYLHVAVEGRISAWAGHRDVLSCMAFGDENVLVTGSYDGQLRMWDTTTGETVRLMMGHQNHVKAVHIVNSNVVCSFARDATLRLWELPDLADIAEHEEEAPPVEATSHRGVSFHVPDEEDEEDTAAGATVGVEDTSRDDTTAEQSRSLASPEVTKSALKQKPITMLNVLARLELPHSPLSTAATSGEEGASLCFLGTSDGYVYGINLHALAYTVLGFVAYNRSRVRRDVRDTRGVVTASVRAARRACRRAIKVKSQALLKEARKAAAARKKEERAERIQAAKLRAQERAQQRMEEEDEEDLESGEEVPEMDEADMDLEELEELEEEEEEEEELDEEGRPKDPLRILDEEKRSVFEAYRKEQEDALAEKVAQLRAAANARIAAVEPLAKTVYETNRDQFIRLSCTYVTKVGGDGVLALAVQDTVAYAVQHDTVHVVDVTPGVLKLNKFSGDGK